MKSLQKLFLFFILAPFTMDAQNLTGKWSGQLSQEKGGLYPEYRFEMELTQKGNQIEGFSYIYANQQQFGKIKLKGTFDGKYFSFQEYEIVRQKIGQNAQWCIKKGTLAISEQKGFYFLQGLWEGYSGFGACVPGKLWISKAIPEQKKVIPTIIDSKKDTIPKELNQKNVNKDTIQTNIQKPIKIKSGEAFKGRTIREEQSALEIKSTELTIEIWDHKDIDGDIISLFHNGSPIVENYTLKSSKYRFKIKINVDEDNFLILHAHNLGTIPPNTAAISVDDQSQSQVRILRSDLNQSEVIRLNFSGK